MRIFDAFMFNGEYDMLDCRLEELKGLVHRHVLVEAEVTHLGYPKPLWYAAAVRRYNESPVEHIVTKALPNAIWAREHDQRDAAWHYIDQVAYGEDWVLICDVDEIPSRKVLDQLACEQSEVVAIDMRTCIFAVDWEVTEELPPTCVAARVRYLRQAGGKLGNVRDLRDWYPRLRGGWHLSWLGGPEAQTAKLETGSCHRHEIEGSGEAKLIRSGERYRTGAAGGGLPVDPVDVDETWPAYVRERRCPPSWFRPRPASR